MKRLLDRDLYQIFNDARNRKIILYGAGSFARDIIEKLRCLDITVSYCVEDDFKNISVGIPVRDIYALLTEREDFFVFIAKENVQRCARMLEGMGLRHLKDYNSFYNAAGKIRPEITYALDPVFGYALPWEETNGTGVKILGDSGTCACRIGILGGSTSDPCVYEWKSWGELFYEKCLQDGRAVSVMIGATAGYSSSAELFKLIRDILPLKPDIVISFSQVNDRASATPYINSYQLKLFTELSVSGQKGMYGQGAPEKVCRGQRFDGMEPADVWIRNQRMMHAIAEEFHYRHIAFIQPNLITKKRAGVRDDEIFLYIDEKEIETKERFALRLEEQAGDLDYLVDATHWLDGFDGLFYDYCHVTEEGNRIIADKVYEYIFEGGGK